MPGRSRVVEVDNGAMALLRKMRSRTGVKVGIVGDAAEEAEQFGEVEQPVNIAYIGAIHEFGSKHAGRGRKVEIPRRSWLRDYVDPRVAILKKRLHRHVVAGMSFRKGRRKALEKSLDLFGMSVVGEIQLRIADGISPPNAIATVESKGSSKPLIDTGRLRQSITHEVVVRKR
jgi:hypothetical protein